MFVIQPGLRILPAPDKWLLTSPAVWRSPELDLTIPAGFVTDLASIPRLLRNLLDVNGRSRYPAILHDWLYSGQWTGRAFADRMLFHGLMDYGESAAIAGVYWAGVRAGGWQRSWGAGLQREDFDTDAAFQLARAMPPPRWAAVGLLTPAE